MAGPMRTVSFKIPVDLDAELTRVARERGESRSAVVRGVLTTLQGGGRASVVDLASGLVGLVDGPVDLSTNEAYLAGLGE